MLNACSIFLPTKTYSLCIDLVDVGQSLCQDVAWHLVPVLVSELGRLTSRTSDGCTSISYGSGHDAADRRREFVDIGDGGGIDELVLLREMSGVLDERVGGWVYELGLSSVR